jgi:hypothetical protein
MLLRYLKGHFIRPTAKSALMTAKLCKSRKKL